MRIPGAGLRLLPRLARASLVHAGPGIGISSPLGRGLRWRRLSCLSSISTPPPRPRLGFRAAEPALLSAFLLLPSVTQKVAKPPTAALANSSLALGGGRKISVAVRPSCQQKTQDVVLYDKRLHYILCVDSLWLSTGFAFASGHFCPMAACGQNRHDHTLHYVSLGEEA